jgi:hypothetical protein
MTPSLAAIAVGVALGLATHFLDLSYRGLSDFEITYRAFMTFYALAFPAYVLICAVGLSGIVGPPSRRSLIVFALAVAAALPCMWVGFIERRSLWLIPGVLIVLLAKRYAGPLAPAPTPPSA